jgi:thioredoxin 1
MPTLPLTKTNFEQVVRGHDLVLVDFWAPWCGPCRSFGPVFEKASGEHPDVVFAKVNTDEEAELAAAFQITSIPTLMAFREQVLLYAEPGALPAPVLDELITRVKTLDMAEVRRRIAEAENDGDRAATGGSEE